MPRINVHEDDDISEDDLPAPAAPDRSEMIMFQSLEDHKALKRDPALLGYPPTLPIEVALRTGTNAEICKSYGISKDEWQVLINDPTFRADVAKAMEIMQQEGMSFKLKARLQAEEMLKKIWRMVHANDGSVPPAVKADLIKFTIRAAGYDGSADKGAGNQQALQININL
jgi:hypothetical protein